LEIKIGEKTANDITTYEQTYTRYTIPNFPWGLTKSVYESAVANKNHQMLSEIG
jgi:hypothetical protein